MHKQNETHSTISIALPLVCLSFLLSICNDFSKELLNRETFVGIELWGLKLNFLFSIPGIGKPFVAK